MIQSLIYTILEPFLIEEGIRRGYSSWTHVSSSAKYGNINERLASFPTDGELRYLVKRSRTKNDSATPERSLYLAIMNSGKFRSVK
jgi:hypothetical protein